MVLSEQDKRKTVRAILALLDRDDMSYESIAYKILLEADELLIFEWTGRVCLSTERIEVERHKLNNKALHVPITMGGNVFTSPSRVYGNLSGLGRQGALRGCIDKLEVLAQPRSFHAIHLKMS